MPNVTEDRFRLLVLAGATVARVVRHELSHSYGIGDEKILDLGAY